MARLRRAAPLVLLALGPLAMACASTRPAATAAPLAPARVATLDEKVAWTLRLEQERILRDQSVGADLLALAADAEVGVRRRAILALGRVGLPEALPVLTAALHDPEESVRAMAAFSMGVMADPAGVVELEGALADPSPVVRGRAAEGLGLIGQAASAAAVANAASACPALLAGAGADDDESPRNPDLEACRLSLFALVRLRQFDALARVALDAQGRPVSQWWPVAFSLQRSGDARSAPALVSLIGAAGVYTPSFAIRGLAGLRDARVVAPALSLAMRTDADVRLRVVAVRALGRLGGAPAVDPLMTLVGDPRTPQNVSLEAVTALGAIGDRRSFPLMLELFRASWPALRAAAMTSAAKIDPEGFLLVISTLERDADFSVRANLADVLATLAPDAVRDAISDLAADPDVRVQGPALRALARVGAPDVDERIFAALGAPDFALRAAAARLVGERRPAGGADRLATAYARGESDVNIDARAAALDAIAAYDLAQAQPTLTRALADREWPIRLRAAALLRRLGVADAAPERPAPRRQDAEFFTSDRVLHPAFSPHAYLETRHGTIEIELNMVDAPVTSMAFIELARAGFYNGLRVHRLEPNFVLQAGDPRGDGEGGPGYTMRDELSPLPYVRGTVGIALSGPDTGGSQFFITLSPQPHLDAKYAVFGRVVQGMDVLDLVSRWDVIERVRIWDGVTLR